MIRNLKQKMKRKLIDWENVKFLASQAGRLHMLPWQHAQKNHIIDRPACTLVPFVAFLKFSFSEKVKKKEKKSPTFFDTTE